jgi:hypothetical protein
MRGRGTAGAGLPVVPMGVPGKIQDAHLSVYMGNLDIFNLDGLGRGRLGGTWPTMPKAWKVFGFPCIDET